MIRGAEVKKTIMLLVLSALLLAACGKKEEVIRPEPVVPDAGEDASVPPAEEPAEAAEEPAAEIVPAEDPDRKVWLILPAEDGPSASIANAVTAACRNLETEAVVRSYDGDIDRQTEIFGEAIADNARLIVCDNADNEQTTTSVMQAKNADIPVFLLNRGIDTMGAAASQIITDSYSCVRELTEFFIEYKGGHSGYVEILGSGSSFDVTEAFHAAIAGSRGMALLASDLADENDEADSYSVIWEMLRGTPEADTLICSNSLQTKQGLDAAADLGMDISVVCLLGDDDSIRDLVEEGKVLASVVKPVTEIAGIVADQIADYLLRGDLPSDELRFVRGQVVTSPIPAETVEEPQADYSMTETETEEETDVTDGGTGTDGGDVMPPMDYGNAGEGLPDPEMEEEMEAQFHEIP